MSTTNNVDNIMSTCAACGKEGSKESMNICNKCKMVHYCNLTCKKKHKSKHKKKCEKHAAKLHDEALFQEPPPREDCPICFLPLPLDPGDSKFQSCCGKIICDGCSFAMYKEGVGRGKTKEEDHLCPYCRESPYCSEEASIKRLKKLMENGNGDAFYLIAGCYAQGRMGMPQDMAKANELCLKAGELGCVEAYHNLGVSYIHGNGVEIDNEKANHFFELAAMSGNAMARHSLGCKEGRAGNDQRSVKHIMIAASAGFKLSLDMVKEGYTAGYVTKYDYENTLRAYHESQTEMKSEARDKAAAFLAQRAARQLINEDAT